ncbi:recombinase family protein [Enterococcus faecalis]|uniref:recombinase family protein n=1 Tax=Enterococcus faecalis TaxID=1351 RepID=UPI00115D4E05|nr:recombinase family protein [Enterococcus faecalis]MBO6338722.1 recombinase family protein [Enterococcus faecalis]MBO6365540.1 recombinase family protein [Enterococcus faecalis]MDH5031344.1 recombinase family protein [Enterococcus faecalis]HAP2890227.1 recombinase family protein [Enterococcus faecalis]HAP2890504.1 recombinase family protein [Enterococcus faecalis]
MMKVGYARVSSKGQNLDRQIEGLSDVSKLFTDKLSGKSTDRPQFQAMLDFIREGDIVVVTELERLGRNNKELTETMLLIQQKGATLEVLNLPTLRGIEDGNLRRLINNLIIEIYKYQAESERKNILEKQAQGIKIAKKNGKFKGGKLKYKENDPKLQHAFKLYLEGETEKDIERITGINRRTFRRYRERFNIQRNKEME